MSKVIDLRKYTKLVPTPVTEITKEQFLCTKELEWKAK